MFEDYDRKDLTWDNWANAQFRACHQNNWNVPVYINDDTYKIVEQNPCQRDFLNLLHNVIEAYRKDELPFDIKSHMEVVNPDFWNEVRTRLAVAFYNYDEVQCNIKARRKDVKAILDRFTNQRKRYEALHKAKDPLAKLLADHPEEENFTIDRKAMRLLTSTDWSVVLTIQNWCGWFLKKYDSLDKITVDEILRLKEVKGTSVYEYTDFVRGDIFEFIKGIIEEDESISSIMSTKPIIKKRGLRETQRDFKKYKWSGLNVYLFDRAVTDGKQELSDQELKNIEDNWDGLKIPKVLEVKPDFQHDFLPITTKKIKIVDGKQKVDWVWKDPMEDFRK